MVLTTLRTYFLSVNFHSLPTTQDVIRVCQISFVPTSPVVIRVGKHISSFQTPPKVIRVALTFLRSNRRRAIRVGFKSAIRRFLLVDSVLAVWPSGSTTEPSNKTPTCNFYSNPGIDT